MQRAGAADLPALHRFLSAHADIAMFALSNLSVEGLAEEGSDGPPRSLLVWVDDPGAITAVIAITREGMLLPVLPGPAEQAQRLWSALAPTLAGRRAIGITGAAGAARAGFDALGFADQAVALDRDEPHFALNLADLIMPDTAGLTLIRPGPDQRALMTDWRAAYHTEVLGTSPGAAPG